MANFLIRPLGLQRNPNDVELQQFPRKRSRGVSALHAVLRGYYALQQ